MTHTSGAPTTTGIPVDANVINSMFQEISTLDNSTTGPIEELFNDVVNSIGLALNDQIIQEWKNACGEQWINQLLPDYYQRGRVTESKPKNDSVIRRDLTTKCGLPTSSKDYRYIACAIRVQPNYVWSQDMDFYHPPGKQASAKAKERWRKQRRGDLCKYVGKQFGVTIGCYCHVRDDLNLGDNMISCPPCHSGD